MVQPIHYFKYLNNGDVTMKILLFLDTNKQMASEEVRSILQLRIHHISLTVSQCQSLTDTSKNPIGKWNRKIIFISFVWHISTVKK